MDGAALGGILCTLVVGIAIVAVVGAVFLRAAVWLYNKMVGGEKTPGSVPEPAFGKAMLIALVVSVVNNVITFVIDRATAASATDVGPGGGGFNVVGQLVALPVVFFVMAGLLSAMLPTTFPRAIMVTLCWMLIALIVVGILAVVLVVVMGVSMRGF